MGEWALLREVFDKLLVGFSNFILIDFYHFTVVGDKTVYLFLHIGGLGIDSSGIGDFRKIVENVDVA